ncbi:isopenicillin N synthase family dioxygenase [Halioxenophilus sp. WMMB6]|uniref:isopenicillin N synthase family dioxygenase n=1 Tax=Halioxenophilus sp. WMMB6 TaxID=3073815 RepID=UPI00295E8D54|nr:2OG-Fe(II) oxygenase family protein [Halioxenophilus sp. WMMB6]
MEITNIDFSSYDESQPATLKALGDQVYAALTSSGFMTVSNIGITQELRDRIFALSRDFFGQAEADKHQVGYRTASENFGYQAMLMEHLDPTKPADIKETFTMRNVERYFDDPSRWPSQEFRDLILYFYDEVFKAAQKLMRVFAAVLKTDNDFFIQRHAERNNVTLRLLHYPSFDANQVNDEQLGAGAHTDYGMITLLFQDGVEGLEVCDKDGNWLSAPAYTDRIIINTGDLMYRWTNDLFRSTPHRVRPQTEGRERFSIAMFIDPDEQAMIETLASCITPDRPNRYQPIRAGEHILQKIQATHGTAY